MNKHIISDSASAMKETKQGTGQTVMNWGAVVGDR